jgi:hypothetical protein
VNSYPGDSAEDGPDWQEYVSLEQSIIATTAKSLPELATKARTGLVECEADWGGGSSIEWSMSLLYDILALDAAAA